MLATPIANLPPATTTTSQSADQGLSTSADAKNPTKKSPTQSQSPSRVETKLSVIAGTEPGTVVINFPPGTTEKSVLAAVGSFGLGILKGDAASGIYTFSVPQIQLYIAPSEPDAKADRAYIHFPSLYTSDDIAAYLGKNKLNVVSWHSDPQDGERVALVEVPRLEATLIDETKGYYSLTLAGAEQATILEWARSAGLRVVSHDAATGVTIVQPLDWVAPTPTITVPVQQESAASGDFIEGVRAFVEKRPAAFEGR